MPIILNIQTTRKILKEVIHKNGVIKPKQKKNKKNFGREKIRIYYRLLRLFVMKLYSTKS